MKFLLVSLTTGFTHYRARGENGYGHVWTSNRDRAEVYEALPKGWSADHILALHIKEQNAMNEVEAIRAAMRAAQPAGKGQYIENGQHQLEIIRALCKRTLQGATWKESYIIEFKVLSSTNPTHEVGSTRSYVENPANQGWLERFKACLVAVAGCDPNVKLSPQHEDTIADIIAALRYDEFRVSKGWPENFLAGRRVACEGMAGTSKKGGAVTNKKWAPLVAAPAQPAAPAGV